MMPIPAPRSDIVNLKSYQAGEQIRDTIRLNANEAPVATGGGTLNRYPEVRPSRLRARLAELLSVAQENLLVTRGSSESIDVLIRSWCRAYQDEILVSPPTFDMYRLYANIQGVQVIEAPLILPDFDLDTDSVLAACTDNTKLIFVCRPNNPTGTLPPPDDILRIATSRLGKSIVVVDEAYIEFSGHESLAAGLSEYPNLVLLRTLSKAHALAGARCGVTIADSQIIDVMSKVLPPYSFPTPVIERVADALIPEFTARSAQVVRDLVAERNRVQHALEDLDCVVRTWPTGANFVLVRFADLDSTYERLMKQRILIRVFDAAPGLENCARITVGTRAENDALLSALASDRGAIDE